MIDKKLNDKLYANGIIAYVNEENRTVTLKVSDYSSERIFNSICDQLGIKRFLRTLILHPYFLRRNETLFVATAKCHPNDTFNANIGVKVALKKLKRRIRRAIIGAIVSVHKDVYPLINKVYDLYYEDTLADYIDINHNDSSYICEVLGEPLDGKYY